MNSTPHINRIPLEILSLIFTITFKLHVNDTNRNSLALSTIPILLSSVCAYWRRTATDTPAVWSCVDIKCLEQATQFFKNSQNSSLRVRFGKVQPRRSGSAQLNDELSSKDMRQLLVKNVPRFESLALVIDSASLETEFLPAFFAQLSKERFKDLAFQIATNRYRTRSASIEIPNEILEALHGLHLYRFPVNLGSFTCHHLVTLAIVDLEDISAEALAHFLNSNPGLRTLKLCGFMSDSYPDSFDSSIELPSLCSLKIESGLDERFILWFIEALVPPQCDLDLRLDGLIPAEVHDDAYLRMLVSFFARISVKSLHLGGEVSIPISGMLEYLPDIKHLGLFKCDCTYPALADMESAVQDLRKLQTISLYECGFQDDDEQIDSDLVELLSIPSVRQIRYFNSSPENYERFCELALDKDIVANIIESPELQNISRSSPFI